MAQRRKYQHEPEFKSSFVIPTGAGANKLLVSNAEGKGEWKSFAIRVPATYGIVGSIVARSWPLTWASIGAGEEQKLVKVRFTLESGTSVLCTIKRNGASITGLTNLEAVSTETKNAEPESAPVLAENDSVDLVTTSPIGNPVTLSFVIFTEHIL